MRFGDLDEAAESQTVDISRRGLYVRMNPPKPIGTRVRFEEKDGVKHRVAVGSGADLGRTGKK